MSDENAMVYAFGAPWGPEPNTADKFFGFKPGRGIHDIHMNQGNPPGKFEKDNGVYQDGALLFNFPDEGQWMAIFLKFQTQAWHTDDVTGNVILSPDAEHPTAPHTPIERDCIPTFEVPDGLVRIVAAYVNDTKSPERETVTLLNTADVAIDLTSWAIADKQKKRMALAGTIDAGGTRVVQIATPVSLSNKGGIITLLDHRGIKVHGVSYTKGQAQQPAAPFRFRVDYGEATDRTCAARLCGCSISGFAGKSVGDVSGRELVVDGFGRRTDLRVTGRATRRVCVVRIES